MNFPRRGFSGPMEYCHGMAAAIVELQFAEVIFAPKVSAAASKIEAVEKNVCLLECG
jgi:AICAR transformylase/IMP cyclohydrolase PurH